MVHFGILADEIVSLVWGTPGNFNGFRVLAALLHDTLEVGLSQTVALNRGRHLYSAGRPSRWALAHILVEYEFLGFSVNKFPQLIKGDVQAQWHNDLQTQLRFNKYSPTKYSQNGVAVHWTMWTITHAVKGLKQAGVAGVQAVKPVYKIYSSGSADVLIIFKYGLVTEQTADWVQVLRPTWHKID